jgi:hypothetical protein
MNVLVSRGPLLIIYLSIEYNDITANSSPYNRNEIQSNKDNFVRYKLGEGREKGE